MNSHPYFSKMSSETSRVVKFASRHLPKIMGVVMLAYAIVNTVLSMQYGGYTLSEALDINGSYISDSLSNIFLIVGGAAILLWRRITLTNTAAIYLISVGSGRFVISITYMFSEFSIIFYVGVVLFCLAINMMVSGVFYLCGVARNRTNTMLSVAGLVILYSVILLVAIRSTGDVLVTLGDNFSMVLQIVMYFMLLALLDTDSVRRNSPMEHVDACIGSAAACICASKDTIVSEEEAEEICRGFSDPSGWEEVNDGGPATYQYIFELSGCDQTMNVLVQRWAGSSKLYFTIARNFEGSLVNANRLSVSYYSLEGDSVKDSPGIRLYSDDGTFIRFAILHKSLDEYLGEMEAGMDENRCPR